MGTRAPLRKKLVGPAEFGTGQSERPAGRLDHDRLMVVEMTGVGVRVALVVLPAQIRWTKFKGRVSYEAASPATVSATR
jgi:hypothetical protein